MLLLRSAEKEHNDCGVYSLGPLSAVPCSPNAKNTLNNLAIKPLRAEDVPGMMAQFTKLGWKKTTELYDMYLREQASGKRAMLVAQLDGKFAGYLTVKWESGYGPFRADGIPEINDFNVLPELRRKGIGSRLMDAAEALIATRSAHSGIGVGLPADYGPAQRMYVLRGYVPDGRGLMDHGQPVKYDEAITVSHEMAIYFTKKLH